MLIQKYIAQSGYCSRRRAEELVKQKKVYVNDQLAVPGQDISLDSEVRVNNKNIQLDPDKVYILLNKPKGYTCTNRKFRKEKNVFDLVKYPAKLFVVGRLDKDSHGLVLLTNDGDLAQKITHPKYEHEKIYQVSISNPEQINPIAIVNAFKKGFFDNGEFLIAQDIKQVKDNLFQITLTQGKKRQIRRMFKQLNCQVLDLKRTSIYKYKLGKLSTGQWRKVSLK